MLSFHWCFAWLLASGTKNQDSKSNDLCNQPTTQSTMMKLYSKTPDRSRIPITWRSNTLRNVGNKPLGQTALTTHIQAKHASLSMERRQQKFCVIWIFGISYATEIIQYVIDTKVNLNCNSRYKINSHMHYNLSWNNLEDMTRRLEGK